VHSVFLALQRDLSLSNIKKVFNSTRIFFIKLQRHSRPVNSIRGFQKIQGRYIGKRHLEKNNEEKEETKGDTKKSNGDREKIEEGREKKNKKRRGTSGWKR